MLGLLNAYHFDQDPNSFQKEYEPMALEYFKRIMPQVPIKSYLVGQGQFPQSIDECLGWIITGSPAGVYEDRPWITQLEEFIRQCHQNRKKLLGICFGHQIIAQALGGVVENSKKGWGVGVRPTPVVGKAPWMKGDEQSIALIYSHQDQVIKMPQDAKLLISDKFCPYGAFHIDSHVFSIQGHPEFSREFAQKRLDTRKELLGDQLHAKATSSLQSPSDEELVGKWIADFFNL